MLHLDCPTVLVSRHWTVWRESEMEAHGQGGPKQLLVATASKFSSQQVCLADGLKGPGFPSKTPSNASKKHREAYQTRRIGQTYLADHVLWRLPDHGF
jgi:hypothetical protein